MQRKHHNRFLTYVAAAGTVVIAAAMIAVGAPAASAAKSITVTGVITGFTPKTINVTAGEQVTITFKNGDAAIPHDLSIPAAGGFKVSAAGGKTATKSFTAPAKSGSYKFFCSIPGHEQAGMVGSLVVASAGAGAPAAPAAPKAGTTAPKASGAGAPASAPQVNKVPAGGVQAGGGSTAGVTHVSLLTLGGGLLVAAMMTALLGWRVARRD
jgi:uncharacterized cupredoxin-like copper-binding protein